MKLDIAEDSLVVVSDLHLGSPASRAAQSFPAFVDDVEAGGRALCLNGDLIDLLQYSFPKLFADVAIVLRRLRQFAQAGGPLYYTLGNHDLVLEHLLAELPVTVAPMLNLRSGGQRIRIEHGHLYEPVYMQWPSLYELGGRVGRFFLLANADVHRGYSRLQQATHARRRRQSAETYPAYRAADALFERGFDAVIFGHTHLPEMTRRGAGLFVNSGDWTHGRTFVTVDRGEVALLTWPADRDRLRPTTPARS